VRILLLAVHISAGVLGLGLGAAAMALPKRPGWHTALGRTYQGAVAVMTSSAVALAALAPARLWPLGAVAVATEACALAGWAARRRHRSGWLARHIRWMASSYLSFVTAALVVNWSNPLAWVLPTLIGTPLVVRTVSRHHPGPRAVDPSAVLPR
jgi:uncharacterized membrane protein